MLLVHDHYSEEKVRRWSSQPRECAPWYHCEELGYDYGMSSIIAGIIRSQFRHLDEHIQKKKDIYERYRKRFDDSLMLLNSVGEDTKPNYWRSLRRPKPRVMSITWQKYPAGG